MVNKTLIFVLFLTFLTAFASGPKQISYQGILTDALGLPKADGAYEMTFKLYSVPSEGNNVWSETKTVQLKNGVFTTILGSDSALVLPFDTTYYLGVSLGTGGEYAPRVQLTSSGYAIRAITADSAVSAYSSMISGSATSAVVADSSRAAHYADTTLKAASAAQATVAATATSIPATAIAANSIDSTKLGVGSVGSSEIADGAIATVDVAATFKAPYADSADTAGFAKIAGSVAGTSISGTIVTSIVKAADSTGLALNNDSDKGIFIDSLGNVGIGTKNPLANLNVNSNDTNVAAIYVSNDSGMIALLGDAGASTDGQLALFDKAGGNISVLLNGNSSSYIASGNVGIGTSNPGSRKLKVDASTSNDVAFETSIDRTTGSNYGTRSSATGNGAVDNFAIWGDAAGATNNWGLYINRGSAYINGNLEIVGSATVNGGVAVSSDLRYKKNIYPIENAIEKLKKLGGFYYDWKIKEFPKKKFTSRRQVGVIAQDVEKVLPEVVHTDENGYKSVSYDKLTALLIEAVKSQQEQLEEQKKVLDKVENTVEMVKNLLNENTLLRKQIASLKEKVDPELKVNLHYDLEEKNNEKN